VRLLALGVALLAVNLALVASTVRRRRRRTAQATPEAGRW
jgi:hypothetical protein